MQIDAILAGLCNLAQTLKFNYGLKECIILLKYLVHIVDRQSYPIHYRC